MRKRAIVFSQILVAVDASERQPAVFDAAAGLALEFNATLYVVRALTISPEFPPAAAASTADPLPPHLKRLAFAELTELWTRAPDLPPTVPIVVVGQPATVILQTAQDLDVDLIVLGSHGYRGWDRVLGTTAAKVVNLADRNVLVVHERTTEATARINRVPQDRA
jgi:nucleotide-binding universal stress UspA family protein